MLQAHGALRAFLSKNVVASVVVVAPVLAAGGALADSGSKKVEPAVHLLNSIPIPISPTNTGTGTFSFDISFVDQSDGTYYLADRNNQAVDALFAESIVKQIVPNNGHMPFAGISPPAFSTATAGPNGVVAAFPWLFVTDAPSRVLSFDLRQNPPLTVSEVTTVPGDPTRADELAYDPKDRLILAINNASTPPVATLISVDAAGNLAVVTNIFLDPTHTGGIVDAQNGAEQPVWDPGTKKFFLSIPQNGPNPTVGAVIRISTTGTVEKAFSISFCSPAGLALGPNEDLLVGCNTIWEDTDGALWTGNADRRIHTAAPQLVILDAKTGNITANVTGAGVGDEVWFNAGDNHYYAASSGSNLAPNALFPARPPVGTAATAPVNISQGAATLDVIDALSETLDQRVPTLNVPADPDGSHPGGTAHSVAAYAGNAHVYVPIAANNAVPNCLTGCITINGRYDPDQD
jgi:hypothetical protein